MEGYLYGLCQLLYGDSEVHHVTWRIVDGQ